MRFQIRATLLTLELCSWAVCHHTAKSTARRELHAVRKTMLMLQSKREFYPALIIYYACLVLRRITFHDALFKTACTLPWSTVVYPPL